MNSRDVLGKTGSVIRLILLMILIVALVPALPAAAEDPEVEASGDVALSASVLLPQETKIYPTDGDDGDNFGISVSMSGDVMAVGAPDNSSAQGAVYLYGRNVGGPGRWGLIKKLTAEDGASHDQFGYSAAIYDTTVVVGAPSATSGGISYGGAVYIFEKDAGGAGAWGQVKKLTPNDQVAYDAFGHSVAIQGSTVVVGARAANIESYTDAGAAYVFGRNVGGADAWGQVKKLTPDDTTLYGYFGYAVAIYGATVAVSGWSHAVNGYVCAGAVYIFSRDAGGSDHWGQTKRVIAPDPGDFARFGESVALRVNTLVVGAGDADVDGRDAQGAAYVFERDLGGMGQWGLRKELIASDGAASDKFGNSVSISDATIVVGAPGRAKGGDDAVGAAYVFSRNTAGANEWGQLMQLTPGDYTDETFYGQAVAIDGATIGIGADGAFGYSDGEDLYTGAAYVYTPYTLRVNSAGPKYIDQAGNLWLADRSWLPGVPITPGTTPWGYVGGIGRVVSTPISNTEDDKLYQSERLYTGAARPGYKFVVPNGRYMLTLKYAETYWGVSGKRKFTVMAENQICFANYDIFMAVGAKNKAAPDKVCYVTVSDGMLDLGFISVAGQAKADAIYIQQLFQ